MDSHSVLTISPSTYSARLYKTFSCSAEYEILNVHKYKKYQEIQHFSGSDKHGMLFFLLKMLKCQQLLAF